MPRGKQARTIPLKVLNCIREHQLVISGDKLLVAVSGGADSVCLLHILFGLQKELGVTLHAAHLNHQLRGAEAETDAQYVSALAKQLNIPCTVEKRDVTAYKNQYRLSLEEAAREVRYDFLAQMANTIGTNLIATGHTTDDHAETILMHLIRGSGTRGLRGLQPRTTQHLRGHSYTIIRPLLPVSRQETTDYCQQYKLAPRTDSSNLSLSPLRNRIRHQLLPLMASYNPQVIDALIRTGQIATDDLAFIDSATAALYRKVTQKEASTIILDKEEFQRLPTAMQRNLLRTGAEDLLGNLKDIEASHIEQILAARNKPAGKKLNLPGGLIFHIEYDRYLLGKDPESLSPLPILEGEFALKIPGTTRLPGWHIQASILRERNPGDSDTPFTAYLDLDKTGSILTVRPRQTGDRFQPLGMSQTKKLGEFMIDARIPHHWRRHIPIVCSPTQIVWVAGYRVDDRVKVTPGTSRILRIEFHPDRGL